MEYEPDAPLLDGGASDVVRELMTAAQDKPAVKLDIARHQVTLTVLDENQQPTAFRWQDGVINAVDSDMQYFEQATFYPGSFPLDDIRRFFTTARLRGASGDLQLQVMEYHNGEVYMTVTSRVESATVFFDKFGDAVPRLGTKSPQDIREGIEDLTERPGKVLALGFRPETGYWAEIQVSESLVERRVRMSGVPVFSSPRSQDVSSDPIPLDEIDPGLLARRQARYGEGQACNVTIDRSGDRDAARITYECPTQTVLNRLDGTRVNR